MAKEKQFMIATWIVYDVWVGCGNLRELGSPKTTATKKNDTKSSNLENFCTERPVDK